MTDAQLIEQALAGDSAAFGQLVNRYQDRLYNALAHQIGSSETAYDLAQDAFVQAYLKLETFERASAFYTWLYRIAFNLAASQRRRARPVVSIEDVRDRLGDEPLDEGPSPDARLEEEEQACLLRRALARLSDEHRAILILREMEGLSYDEIAHTLDLPVGTVRSRLHRARLLARDELKGMFQERTS